MSGGADGVGLLRTEFLFLGRARRAGRGRAAAASTRRPCAPSGAALVLRTLDAGADKPLAYLRPAGGGEPLPRRARHPPVARAARDCWSTQLRAALRAAADGPVSVMFPMISELAELRAARGRCSSGRGPSCAPRACPPDEVEVGAMVEVPAAAVLGRRRSRPARSTFLSIGTNDLVQYTMAAERGNAGWPACRTRSTRRCCG